MIAMGYASCARGTGTALMKIGTIIPPPVQANTILTSLYENGAVGLILLKTFFPGRARMG